MRGRLGLGRRRQALGGARRFRGGHGLSEDARREQDWSDRKEDSGTAGILGE